MAPSRCNPEARQHGLAVGAAEAKLLDGLSDAVIVTALDGTIAYFSARAEALYAWRREEVLGRNILDVTPAPELRERGAEILAALSRGDSWSGEFTVRRRDGSAFVAQVTDSPFLDAEGQLAGVVGISRDASAARQAMPAGEFAHAIARMIENAGLRAHAARRLDEERRVYETLFRIGSALATEHDEQELVQLVTDEATALTGANFGSFFFNTRDDRGEAFMLYTLSGAPREAFARFPLPRATPIFGVTFRGEGIVRSADITKDPRYGAWGLQPEGHLPVVSYLAVPVVSRDGEVLGGLFFGHAEPGRFTETHERIVAGIAGQAAVALENARLYAALRKSETAAREAERRKDEFLAMLGHELRNPLAPIVTALDLMTMRGAAPKEAQVIDRQVRHMIRLVDDLLDLSRVTSGKVELKREPVDIASCLARAVEMASPLIEQRRHRISLELADGPLLVNGDATRLGQVFANLLNNAAKYTEPGGRIVVSARREGAAVRTSVRDDGIGIRADLLPHVFEAFVQNPRSLDRSQGGLGVGLAIVRSLVERHGGGVEAKSDGPGRGTEVVVTLPALDEAAAGRGRAGSSPGDLERPGEDAAAGASGGARPGGEGATRPADGAGAAPAPAPKARPRKRVLVVDDNADAADLVAELLRERGHEVVVAEDGPSALRVAERFVPDVAILDIGLPVMNGYELAAELRRGPARGARLIAVTGYGQASDRARAEAAGFAVHLVKPVDFAALEASVEG